MKILLFALTFVLLTGNVNAGGFQSFDDESKRATKELKCQSPKVFPATSKYGKLYRCRQGNGATVKWFINETPNSTNQVKNIKFLWNDWFLDGGYGIHTDKAEAQKAITALVKLYAGGEQVLTKAFWSNKNKVIEYNGLTIEYTYERGSKIDERMILITEQ